MWLTILYILCVIFCFSDNVSYDVVAVPCTAETISKDALCKGHILFKMIPKRRKDGYLGISNILRVYGSASDVDSGIGSRSNIICFKVDFGNPSNSEGGSLGRWSLLIDTQLKCVAQTYISFKRLN